LAFQQLLITVSADEVETVEQYLNLLGASAITLLDAKDESLLEPLPGSTPLWSQTVVVALFPGDMNLSGIIRFLSEKYADCRYEMLPDAAWEKAFLQHAKPKHFGENLWVIPNETDIIPENAVVVRLGPGLAFGTGTHPTTSLCLQWLAKHPPLNQVVLDYGCGSGILAIAALKLGAKIAIGVDYDPQAITATQANAEVNNIAPEMLTAFLPEHFTLDAPVDCLTANILAGPLCQLAEAFSQYVKPGGSMVLSGILNEQVGEVMDAYRPWFVFSEDAVQSEQEWASVSGIRSKTI